MHQLLKKLGLSDTISAVLMILFGVGILLFPRLLTTLVALYLIIVGILKLTMH